eukprot:NODE_837_length_3810_cov_0.466990.p1 type:complete len:446 gc:universal NODE_837_length_3810_cov_0.466990:795-2132(+)
MSIWFIENVKCISIDCPKLTNLAIGLNMDKLQPEVFNSIFENGDCCIESNPDLSLTSPIVTCKNGRVDSIVWENLSLDGFINSSAIPSNTNLMRLNHNYITGDFPNFPNNLKILNLWQNNVNGTLPLQFPLGLVYLILDDNLITGQLPSKLPNNLDLLTIDGNRLTGSIENLTLGQLSYLRVSNNMLVGKLPSIPVGLNTLIVHNNYLNGNASKIPMGVQSLYLGYENEPGNKFTGVLRLLKPVKLYINYNLISDIEIKDSSALIECDISYNPLLDSQNLDNLNSCTKKGIYKITPPDTFTSVSPWTLISGKTSDSTLLEETTILTASLAPEYNTNIPSDSAEKWLNENSIVVTVFALFITCFLAIVIYLYLRVRSHGSPGSTSTSRKGSFIPRRASAAVTVEVDRSDGYTHKYHYDLKKKPSAAVIANLELVAVNKKGDYTKKS